MWQEKFNVHRLNLRSVSIVIEYQRDGYKIVIDTGVNTHTLKNTFTDVEQAKKHSLKLVADALSKDLAKVSNMLNAYENNQK